MTRPPQKTGRDGDVDDQVKKTLELMTAINRKTEMLLRQTDSLAERLMRIMPGIEVLLRDEEAVGVSDAHKPPVGGSVAASDRHIPSSDRFAAPLPEKELHASPHVDDHIVDLAVEKVMTKIQPLLDALERVHAERAAPRQMSEAEYLAQMLEEMRLRTARRRGFLPIVRHPEENDNER